jgi:putative DNA primase/helicase
MLNVASVDFEEEDNAEERRGFTRLCNEAWQKKHGPKIPEFSEEALALAFAAEHADFLRYVAFWSKWLRYESGRWSEDNTLHTFDLIRRKTRGSAGDCDQPKTATAIASAKTVAAIERLARSDRRLAATIDQWDPDPWMLNTPAGIVDLQNTGNLYEHHAPCFLTKMTAVAPGGECPQWREFLRQITDGDSELEAFLARVFGYAATSPAQRERIETVRREEANVIDGDYTETPAAPARIDAGSTSRIYEEGEA